MFPIIEISDVDFAFPAKALGWIPKWEAIPEEFKDYTPRWSKQLVSDWFYSGVEDLHFYAKPGVDAPKAFRFIQAVMRSFAPTHEHKMAALAYLLEDWFENVEWRPIDKRKEKSVP